MGIIFLHSLKVAATGHRPPKWSRTGNMPTVSNSLKNHGFLSISKHKKVSKRKTRAKLQNYAYVLINIYVFLISLVHS